MGTKCPKPTEECSHRIGGECEEPGIGIDCYVEAVEALKEQRDAAVELFRRAAPHLPWTHPSYTKLRDDIQAWQDRIAAAERKDDDGNRGVPCR